ncbi:hypothetical protein HK102_010458, partial [Quaeritorhiza haematococci]
MSKRVVGCIGTWLIVIWIYFTLYCVRTLHPYNLEDTKSRYIDLFIVFVAELFGTLQLTTGMRYMDILKDVVRPDAIRQSDTTFPDLDVNNHSGSDGTTAYAPYARSRNMSNLSHTHSNSNTNDYYCCSGGSGGEPGSPILGAAPPPNPLLLTPPPSSTTKEFAHYYSNLLKSCQDQRRKYEEEQRRRQRMSPEMMEEGGRGSETVDEKERRRAY